MGALRFLVVLGVISVFALGADGRAQELEEDDSPEAATVRVASVGGGRTRGEADAILERSVELLARCASEGRAARGAPDVRVRLEVAASGRASTLAIVGDGDPRTPQYLAWRDCAVRSLSRSRLARGQAGTIDLFVRWHVPRDREPPVVGGLRGRPGGGPPSHMRSDPASRPVAVAYPREELQRVAREHASEVRSCYDAGLAVRPDLHGTITVRFTITTEGRVASAEVATDDMRMPSVGECVIGRLRAWTFPAPPSGEAAEVTHPFVFRSH